MGENKLLISIILALVMSLPFIYGQSNSDYKIYSKTSLDICSCGFLENNIIIENTGFISNRYLITEKSPYIEISPETFILHPGSRIEINELIDVPCDLKGEIYPTIDIVNDQGLKKSFSQIIKADSCNNLLVQPVKTNLSGNPCQEYNVLINLYNPGPFEEEYELSISDFKGKINLISPVKITPGKGKRIDANIIPICENYGSVLANLFIKAKTTNLVADIPISLNIEKDYDFSLKSDQSIEICIEEGKNIEIEIENEAKLNNTYTIDFEADGFSISEQEIELNNGESKDIFVTVPPNELDSEEGEIFIEVFSKIGDIDKNLTIQYVASECFKHTIESEIDNICLDDEEIVYNLIYNGTDDQKIQLQLESDEAFSLKQDSIEVLSNEEKRIKIEIDNEKFAEGEKSVKIISSFLGKNYTKEFENNIDVFSLQDCYKPAVWGKVYVKHYGEPYPQKYFNIENRGIKETKYKISQESQNWIEIIDDKINLKPGEKTVFSVNTFADNIDKKGKYQVDFKLTSDTDQEYYQTIIFNVYDYSFGDFFWEFKCFFIIGFFIICFILSSILAYINRRNKKCFRGYMILVSLSLFAIFLICSLCFNSFKEFYGWEKKEMINESDYDCLNFLDNITCSSSQYIRWDEDSNYNLNLNEFFFDPDGDGLLYSFEEPQNISIEIFEDVAKLKPSTDWYGIEIIKFTVTDQLGLSAHSSEFFLHVINKEEFYLSDYLLENHNYIVSALIIFSIILFFIFLTGYFDLKKEEKEKEKKLRSKSKRKKIKKL